MTTTKTRRPAEGLQDHIALLHATPEEAVALFAKEQKGGRLTKNEQAICSLNYCIQTAKELVSAVCYAGQDVTISGEQERLWRSGHDLVDRETIGLQAVGYGFIMTAIAETPGLLDATIARLRKDLHPVLDHETLFAVIDSLLADRLAAVNGDNQHER